MGITKQSSVARSMTVLLRLEVLCVMLLYKQITCSEAVCSSCYLLYGLEISLLGQTPWNASISLLKQAVKSKNDLYCLRNPI